jgi:hypothetical protein
LRAFQIVSNLDSIVDYRPRAGQVDINDDENIQKWAKVLGISESKLLESVDEFGTVITEIRKGLSNRNR